MPGKKNLFYICSPIADVAKLVDALDLGSSVARRGGSSPFIRTDLLNFNRFFLCLLFVIPLYGQFLMRDFCSYIIS